MKASPYMLEEAKKQSEAALESLALTFDSVKLQKSMETQKNFASYKEKLLKTLEKLRDITAKYPEDKEVSQLLQRINEFYKTLGGFSPDNLEKEHKTLGDIDYNLGQIIHWRKLESASARLLPFKDYRRGKERRGAR